MQALCTRAGRLVSSCCTCLGYVEGTDTRLPGTVDQEGIPVRKFEGSFKERNIKLQTTRNKLLTTKDFLTVSNDWCRSRIIGVLQDVATRAAYVLPCPVGKGQRSNNSSLHYHMHKKNIIYMYMNSAQTKAVVLGCCSIQLGYCCSIPHCHFRWKQGILHTRRQVILTKRAETIYTHQSQYVLLQNIHRAWFTIVPNARKTCGKCDMQRRTVAALGSRRNIFTLEDGSRYTWK